MNKSSRALTSPSWMRRVAFVLAYALLLVCYWFLMSAVLRAI